MKLGVIDVGGGMRGIYAAGVLDRCMAVGIQFDLCIGISAGAGNLISYVCGQKGRNYKYYIEYCQRNEYASVGNFFKHGCYIDLDYIYGTLSKAGGENPIDYPKLMASPKEWIAVATDAQTGQARYFGKEDLHQDDYAAVMASCTIPIACKPRKVEGRTYFDGALADPVPVKLAFEKGCDKVVLILTKPETDVRTSKQDDKLVRLMKRKYPKAAQDLHQRADTYNAGVALAKEYRKKGKVLILSPKDTCGVDTLCKDVKSMKLLYGKGYVDAAAIRQFLNA